LPEETERAALYFGGRAVLEKALLESLRREVLERDIRTEAEFRACAAGVVRALFEKGHALVKAAGEALEAFAAVRPALREIIRNDRGASRTVQAFGAGIEAELGRLMPKDFLERYGLERLGHLPRYLKALELRVERARQGLEKDRQKAAQVKPFAAALEKLQREVGEPETGTGTARGEAGGIASAAIEGEPGKKSLEIGIPAPAGIAMRKEAGARRAGAVRGLSGGMGTAAGSVRKPAAAIKSAIEGKAGCGAISAKQSAVRGTQAELGHEAAKSWAATGRRSVSAAKRAAVEELRWLVEEFKVSLFAPELRTAVPVSAKRLEARLKEIAALE
ncbi:MAG: DUF3418 domain-containing protein, partial [Candidatus Aminicenantes bacterium]|nr:DUF3418 domain-containing protein [Candidatus Aminicenantes bacterium]